MKVIEVWAPKYSTNSVLVATHKVVPGVNKIIFTKAKHLVGGVYTIDGAKARTYPKQKNGAGEVYVIPFNDFEIEQPPTKQD